jgi:hypothetical protein
MSTHEEDAAMSDAPTPQTPQSTTPGDEDGESERGPVEKPPAPDMLSDEVLKNPGRRVTSNVSHLIIEAELVAEGKDLDNPAQPAGPEVVDDVMRRLEAKDGDLRPAWAVADDE